MYSSRVCTNCDKELHPSKPYIRCCDADVCSDKCAKQRMKFISEIDPKLTSPMSWPGTQSLTLQDSHLKNIATKTRSMRRSISTNHIMTALHEDDFGPESPLLIHTDSPLPDSPDAGGPPTPHRTNKIAICLLGCITLALITLLFA